MILPGKEGDQQMPVGMPLAECVLLADPKQDFRDQVGDLLTSVGYQVDKTATLESTLKQLMSQPYDRAIVALDLFGSGHFLDLGNLKPFIEQDIPITLVSNEPDFGTVQGIFELNQDKGKIHNWVLRREGPEGVLRAISIRAIILHISDLQFRPYQREIGISASAPTMDPIDIQVEKLKYDLTHELHVQPNIVVVTGDLTEHGYPKQFAAVEQFLRRLAKVLNLPTESIVVTPGNHDVCWPDAAAAFAKAVYDRTGTHVEEDRVDEGVREQILREDVLFQKFVEYQKFYDRLYEGKRSYTAERLYDVFQFSKLNVLVVSLNSCRHACHLSKEGWIGNDQVLDAQKALDKLDPKRSCLRIAVFHHHIYCKCPEDFNDRLADFDDIKLSLQHCNFSILMHGHQHKSAAFRSEDLGGRRLTILAAGSLLLRDDKTIHGNHYQVLEMDMRRSRARLHLRRYDKDRESPWGRGSWGADISNVYAQNGAIEFEL